jgi:hypothetical protein
MNAWWIQVCIDLWQKAVFDGWSDTVWFLTIAHDKKRSEDRFYLGLIVFELYFCYSVESGFYSLEYVLQRVNRGLQYH